MIIIGYQGIGKSTLSKGNGYIDLESGNFFINGKRPDEWFVYYCNIAEHLSKQGNVVFISSHKVVREQLRQSEEKVFVCVPSLELKEEWIEKLKKRYDSSNLEKDFKAYMNALNEYEENISDIVNSGFSIIEIKNMDYDLESLIHDNTSIGINNWYRER